MVESYSYDAYGIPSIFDGVGNPIATSAVGNPFLYTAREWDAETGLYHYRARAYSPHLGRFLQRDPLGQGVDANLYRYTSNNPLNWIDPLGWEKKKKESPNQYGFSPPFQGNGSDNSSAIPNIFEKIEAAAKFGFFVDLNVIADIAVITKSYGIWKARVGPIHINSFNPNNKIPNKVQSIRPLVQSGFVLGEGYILIWHVKIGGIYGTGKTPDSDLSGGNLGNFPGGNYSPDKRGRLNP